MNLYNIGLIVAYLLILSVKYYGWGSHIFLDKFGPQTCKRYASSPL